MNERASDPDKKKKVVKEDVLTKVSAKQDVAEQGIKKRKGGHMKKLARKRKRPQSDVDSNDELKKCLKIVTFEGTIDSDIMEKKSLIARMNTILLSIKPMGTSEHSTIYWSSTQKSHWKDLS
ncbi:hypothetical protein Tco_0416237 [Tanacetum coccineum]